MPAWHNDEVRPVLDNLPDDVLSATFGYPAFRPGQFEVVHDVLRDRDTLAVMPTGGGKSVCYQVPALCRPGLTLVVSPLIALMEDQTQALRARGVAAGCIHSGQDRGRKGEVFAAMRDGDRFLLYLSPERVQAPAFQEWFRRQQVNLVAVDEAHCISQWGHDFRPDYTRLSVLRDLQPEAPILALTATATPEVLDDIARQLGMQKPARHVFGFYRANLFYQVEPCEDDGQKGAWLREAIRATPRGRIIVYCATRAQTEQLAAELGRFMPKVGFYHAGLPTDERERIQSAYGRGELRILCATNAFGMGIDHPDVRLVVHWAIPGTLEALYQEMGRAGRDGRDSTCLVLLSRRDMVLQRWFIEQGDAPAELRRRRKKALDTLIQFAEGGDCRHGGILTYFRDSRRLESCGHCDACDPDAPRRIRLDEVPVARRRGKAPRERRLTVDTKQALDGVDLERFGALKEWRRKVAHDAGMPAFMVMSDKTLRAIAVHNPASLDELGRIQGMGDKRLDQFGAALIRVLGEVA